MRRRLVLASVALLASREVQAVSHARLHDGHDVPVLAPPGERAARCETEWRSLYWSLFRDAAFGASRTERAAWVVWDAPDTVRLVRWPYGAHERRERWTGTVRGPLAVLHTHPDLVDPAPSPDDLALAARLGLPVYTVSRAGVFRGMPDGRVVRVADDRWFDGCTAGDGCPRPAIELAGTDDAPAACGAA